MPPQAVNIDLKVSFEVFDMTPGEKGGLILMGVGSLLTGLMFVYLMIA